MIDEFVGFNLPNAGGAIWLGVLLAYIVFGDFARLRSPRNLALAGLLVTTPFLNGVLVWQGSAPTRLRVAFAVLFLVTAARAAWAFILAAPANRSPWTPNLPVSALRVILGVLVTLGTLFVFERMPDDAGHYTSLGAQRWLDTGVIPYADSALVGPDSPGGGAASTYGPLLYVAHMPVMLLIGRPANRPGADVMDQQDYRRASPRITQFVCWCFYIVGLVALYRTIRQLAGEATALGGVILYAAHPIMWGLDSGRGTVGGLTYVSHIAPPAMILLALAMARRAAWSGGLFAAAAGVLYFPAFMFPAWLGWRWWRKDRPIPFVAAWAVAGLVILGILDVFTPGGMREALGAFMNAAFGHQEGTGPGQYGGTTFGFWGTEPALRRILHDPVVAGAALTSPVFLAFLAFCVAAFFRMRRGGSVARLAAISASVGAAVQLWKSHGVGTYLEWYLPLLILALVAGDTPDSRAAQPESAT